MKRELMVVTQIAALEALRPAWMKLLERSEHPAPTMTPEWLLSWWRVFSESRSLRAGLVFEDGRLIGFAPLLARRHWYRSCLPFRRLELLGTGEDEADETCSDYVGILAERGQEEVVAAEIASGLVMGAFGAWDELHLSLQDGSSKMPDLVGARLNRGGIPTTKAVINHCPYIPLPATFEDYLAALSPTHRALVRRSMRAFERWSGGEVRFEQVERAEDLPHGVSILRDLHAERWQDHRSGGVFGSNRFSAFHRAVLPQLLEKGQVELCWLSVRGEPVAAQYNLIYGDTVYFYQSGRKLDVPSGVRPGTVMHAYSIRRAIEAGRKEYDFLAGSQRYKLELSLASRPLVELRAVRPVVLETARRMADLGAAQVRALRASVRWLRGGAAAPA